MTIWYYTRELKMAWRLVAVSESCSLKANTFCVFWNNSETGSKFVSTEWWYGMSTISVSNVMMMLWHHLQIMEIYMWETCWQQTTIPCSRYSNLDRGMPWLIIRSRWPTFKVDCTPLKRGTYLIRGMPGYLVRGTANFLSSLWLSS